MSDDPPGDGPDDPVDGAIDDAFDEEWESTMERRLQGTGYDAELGLEMAKDAQRLAAGELTEAEFFDRYHEAVLEEMVDAVADRVGQVNRAKVADAAESGDSVPTATERSD